MEGFFRTAEHYAQPNIRVNKKVTFGRILFLLSIGQVDVKRLNSAELLRNRVKAAVSDRGSRRALMRAMGLKSQGTITQWLDYAEHSPPVDKLDSIAAFLKTTVADLFVPLEPSSTSVPDQDGETSVESASPLSKVSVDAATISALQLKLKELKAKYDELHDDVEGTIKHLGFAVGAKVTTSGVQKPQTRRHGKKNAG